jgi:hypothetical protein
MTVRIAPTLAAMADIYQLSTDGGPESPRFTKYVDLNRDGYPVAGFNPMTTSKDPVKTIEALIELDAEELASATANDCARELGLRADIGLSITVATPGMWTDRLATEIEHRIGGRRWSEILLWSGEEVDADKLRLLTRAQMVRAGWATIHQPPRTVAQLAGQEGLVGAVARDPGEDAPSPDPTVAEVLATVGEDSHLATRAAFLYGDDVARKMGWTPLGVGPSGGYAHSIAVAIETLSNPKTTTSKLLRSEWTPLDGTSTPTPGTPAASAEAPPAAAVAATEPTSEAPAPADDAATPEADQPPEAEADPPE